MWWLFVVFILICFVVDLVFVFKTEFSFPAEFQVEHEAIWIAWASKMREEYKKGHPIRNVHLEIIKSLIPTVRVNILVENNIEEHEVTKYLDSEEVDMKKITFFQVSHDDIWIRDFGPIFVTSEETKQKAISIFDFNTWGYDLEKKEHGTRINAQVGSTIADILGLAKIQVWPTIVSEGGDRTFNGKGKLIVTESVEFQRNPNMTKSQIEKSLKSLLGVTQILWAKKGVIEDDQTFLGKISNGTGGFYTCMTTGGHNDEHIRFVDESTVLINYISEEEYNETKNELIKENYRRMTENEQIMLEMGLNVIHLPVPEIMYDTLYPEDTTYEDLAILKYKDGTKFPYGDPIQIVLPTSYMNFLITNKVVLYPRYWKEGRSEKIKQKDEDVKKILSEVFPDRELKSIAILDVNYGGGGIHCITQQEPKV